MLYLSLEAPICSLQTKYALIRLKNEDLTSQTVSPTLKDSSPYHKAAYCIQIKIFNPPSFFKVKSKETHNFSTREH